MDARVSPLGCDRGCRMDGRLVALGKIHVAHIVHVGGVLC